MTGRITQHGDEIAVETDLVNVSDGTQMWGQRYTRKLSDVAALQNEIVTDLSAKLRTQLTHQQKEAIVSGRDDKFGGLSVVPERPLLLESAHSENIFSAVLSRSNKPLRSIRTTRWPTFGLADAYNVSSGFGMLQSKEAIPLAEAAAESGLGTGAESGLRACCHGYTCTRRVMTGPALNVNIKRP